MRIAVAAFMTLALFAFSGESVAQASSIDGSWRGEGTVKLDTGEAEKVRCRIRYEESTGRTLVFHASCAHTHGIFEQSGRIVRKSDSHYTGHLYNNQYSVAADISINVNGGRQTLTAKTEKGSAVVVLTKQ